MKKTFGRLVPPGRRPVSSTQSRLRSSPQPSSRFRPRPQPSPLVSPIYQNQPGSSSMGQTPIDQNQPGPSRRGQMWKTPKTPRWKMPGFLKTPQRSSQVSGALQTEKYPDFESPETLGERDYSYLENLYKTGNKKDLKDFIDRMSRRLKRIVDRYATERQKDLCLHYNYNPVQMLDTLLELLVSSEKLELKKCGEKLQVLESIFKETTDDLREEIKWTREKMANAVLQFQEVINEQRNKMYKVKLNGIIAQERVKAFRESKKVYLSETHESIDQFLLALRGSLRDMWMERLPEMEQDLIMDTRLHIECENKIAEVLEERKFDGEDYLLKYEAFLARHDFIREAVIGMKVLDLEPERAVDECIQRLEATLEEKRETIESLFEELEKATEQQERLREGIQRTRVSTLAEFAFEPKQQQAEESMLGPSLDLEEAGSEGFREVSQSTVEDSILHSALHCDDAGPGKNSEASQSPETEVLRASSPEHLRQPGVSFLSDQTPWGAPLQDSPSPPRDRSIAEISGPSPPLGIASETFAVSPLISKSRFGYTDPKVPFKKLNLPPGPAFQAPTPFQQTIVLTSPKREEPLLVNIAVDPKPLEDTERGESFVCDISLDVQPGHCMLPGINEGRMLDERFRSPSPVIRRRRRRYKVINPDVTPRYDLAPDVVTPRTPLMRDSMTTPTGVFKRGQFNIRTNLFSAEYPPESDESYYWTPQSSPAAILRPSYRYQLSESDQRSPSPVFKGRYVDDSWDHTPSSQEWQYTPSSQESPEWQYTPSPHESPEWQYTPSPHESPEWQYTPSS